MAGVGLGREWVGLNRERVVGKRSVGESGGRGDLGKGWVGLKRGRIVGGRSGGAESGGRGDLEKGVGWTEEGEDCGRKGWGRGKRVQKRVGDRMGEERKCGKEGSKETSYSVT